MSNRGRTNGTPRIAVVTGASAGIGGATSRRLLRDGWGVVGVDINREGFEVIVSEHAGPSGFVHGDVQERLTHESAREAAGRIGRLSAWVNNAGIEQFTRAHDLDDRVLERVLRVNLYGYVYGCSVACMTFVTEGTPGAIVNVSSIRAIAAFPSGLAYEASKGGVEALTRQVAVEYGHVGIRCNGVRPGCIMTPMSQKELDASDDPERLLKEWGDLHPLRRRIGGPHEVAAVIAFLLSEDASFISGELVNVDGGATARCYAYPPDPTIVEGAPSKSHK